MASGVTYSGITGFLSFSDLLYILVVHSGVSLLSVVLKSTTIDFHFGRYMSRISRSLITLSRHKIILISFRKFVVILIVFWNIQNLHRG